MRAPRRTNAALAAFLIIVASCVIVATRPCATAGDAGPGVAVDPGLAGVRFDAPGGLVIVRAGARDDGGHARRLRLLLDTGDPGGVTLFASAARALGLSLVSACPGVVHGLNGSAPFERKSARLPALALDAMAWRDLPIDVLERSDSLPAGIGAELEGVIGCAMVRDTRLTIDYAARRLWLVPGGGMNGAAADAAVDVAIEAPGERSEILRFIEGRLLTRIDAGGATLPALIDTASARTLIERGAGLSSTTEGSALLADATGGATSYPTIRVRDLVVGGAAIESAELVEVDLGSRLAPFPSPGSPAPRAVVGADILSGRRVVIDPAAGRFILGPVRGRPDAAPGRPAPAQAAPDATLPPARLPESGARSAGRRPSRSD